MAQPIYLDYAAATPLDPVVLAAMQPYFSTNFYNPSALYLAAHQVGIDIEAARSRLAHWLGARPPEIVFMAGGTEANNLAIHGVMQRFPGANIIVSAIEHESVLRPAGIYDCRVAAVGPDGILDLASLQELIDEHTVLISVMYANNEVGTIQPLKRVRTLARAVLAERRQQGNDLPLYIHTDACQAANYLDLHAARLGVDLLTLNGGKIYGPKQSGALYVRSGLKLQPQILGGGQERGLRSGTENVAQIVGLSVALDKVQSQRQTETSRLQQLQQDFIQQLQKVIPGVVINGSLSRRLPNNVHITIPGADNERLIMALDQQGIQCAAGSACSASNEDPSHVLRAMGLNDAEAQASLRFTLGQTTTLEQLQTTIKTLQRLLA
jgi:cysteine desulfurase